MFYATASKEAAYDGAGRNGPLTRHILDHIRTRNLKIEDFFKLVTSGVRNETRGYRKPQTPYTYSSFSGQFCFAGCGGVIDRAAGGLNSERRDDAERETLRGVETVL